VQVNHIARHRMWCARERAALQASTPQKACGNAKKADVVARIAAKWRVVGRLDPTPRHSGQNLSETLKRKSLAPELVEVDLPNKGEFRLPWGVLRFG